MILGDSDFSEYIGVGETWGYAMGYYMANKKMGKREDPGNKWFKPYETKKLFDEKKVTPLQFLDCMDNQAINLDILTEHLLNKNTNISKTLYK